MTYYANVYSRDRVFGGTEEGGWWVDIYDPKASHKCKTKAGATFKLNRLKKKFPCENEYPIHSVVFDGSLYVYYIEDHEAAFQPDPWPHYC